MRRIRIKNRRKKSRTGLLFITVVVLLMCGIVSYSRIGLEAASQSTQEKLDECNKAKVALEKEVKQNEKEKILTDQEIEKIAREKFGLVYQDEIIFEPEE